MKSRNYIQGEEKEEEEDVDEDVDVVEVLDGQL